MTKKVVPPVRRGAAALDDHQKQAALAMLKAEKPQKAVAREFGVSQNTISGLRYQNGVRQ